LEFFGHPRQFCGGGRRENDLECVHGKSLIRLAKCELGTRK
jgi:hypothetical protein